MVKYKAILALVKLGRGCETIEAMNYILDDIEAVCVERGRPKGSRHKVKDEHVQAVREFLKTPKEPMEMRTRWIGKRKVNDMDVIRAMVGIEPLEMYEQAVRSGGDKVAALARKLGLSRTTVYTIIRKIEAEPKP